MTEPLLRLRRWARPRRQLRAGLTQLLAAVAGIGGALLLTEALAEFGPQAAGARVVNLLIALGVGMLSIAAIVFTLLFMVVQWAAGNLSPRLGLFRYDPVVWRTFGFIIAVFLFCLTAAIDIGHRQNAPILVAAVAIALALIVVALIRRLQIKAFASIQLGQVLHRVTAQGTQILHDLTVHTRAANRQPDMDGPHQTVPWPGPATVLQQLNIRKLVAAAARADTVIVMHQPLGSWLLPSAPLCTVHNGQTDTDTITQAVYTGPEPVFGQDPMFAFRLLADIGLRALSTAVNDPATAVQALDHLHALYLHLAGHQPSSGIITDADGTARLVVTLPSFDDYLRIGLDDIIAYRGRSPLVQHRLIALLQDLHERATPQQQPAVAARLAAIGPPADPE